MEPRRIDYTGDGISETQLRATPIEQIRAWVEEAVARGEERDDVKEPTALSVATVDGEGRPNVRTVLMRELDARGPVFYTATTSAKGRELFGNPHVAAAITWAAMYRAIRFRGRAVEVDRAEVEAYWRSRPWGSRISAWASEQSRPVSSRADLETAYERRAAQFPDRGGDDDVPLPDFWGGYRIVPDEVELWGGRRNRLHDRIVYTRVGDGDLADARSWKIGRRQP